MSGGEFKSLEESLEKNLPKEDYDEVRRILYGKNVEKLECPEETFRERHPAQR